MQDSFSKLVNFIIPQTCYCGELVSSDNTSLCHDCWVKLDYISQKSSCSKCGYPMDVESFSLDSSNLICPACIKKSPNFHRCFSIFKYNDFASDLISSFKYFDKTNLSEFFSRAIIQLIKRENIDFDLIISVPISKKRLLQRKFNQSSLLVNKIAKSLTYKYSHNVIKRTKHIPPQVSLSREKRLKNVRGAFEISQSKVDLLKGKRILLIDDVYTTGATINEISKILKKAEVANITVITLARTVIS